MCGRYDLHESASEIANLFKIGKPLLNFGARYNKMINARAETVAERPAVRAAFKHRRCLVPATGYFE